MDSVSGPSSGNAAGGDEAGHGRAPSIEVTNLSKRFGEFEALSGIDLKIREGEFFSLLGPSGCGKTTLLRILGGLELHDEGEVRIGGVDARSIPAHRRPVNTVFQSYALFPHLTVADNIAFGLRMKGVDPDEISLRTHRAMEMVQIVVLASRRPAQLSGGQKQRVALARALVNEPKVLLLDEPLGALDLKLRRELQVELLTLQRRLGITFVFVTHDQEEALAMSDRIAVMRGGKIEQIGEAAAIYERPATRFVSQFLGSCNLIDASVTSTNGEIVADTPLGRLSVEPGANTVALAGRDRCVLAIRPEKVTLTAGVTEGQSQNHVPVFVRQLIYIGSETHYHLTAAAADGTGGAIELTAHAMNSRAGAQGFGAGQSAIAHLPPSGLVVLTD